MQGVSDDLLIIILSLIIVIFLGILFWIIWKVFLSHSLEHRLQKMLKNREFTKLIDTAVQAQKNHSSFFLHYYLGCALEESAKFTEALVQLEQSSTMIPHTDSMYQAVLLRIGRLLLKMAKTEEALSYFMMLNKVDESYFESQYEIARIYYDRKQFSRAHDALQNILEIKPGVLDARFLFGKVLYETAQYSHSLKQFELLTRFQPNEALIPYYKALNLEKLKMYGAALTELDKYLSMDLTDKLRRESAQVRLIQLYIKTRDIEGGVIAARKVLDEVHTGPHLPEILYLYAHLLWDRGQEYDALLQWEKVYQIDPRYKDIQIIYDKYSRLFSRSSLAKYFTANEREFEQTCLKILGLNEQDLLYRSLHYYLFGRGKQYSIFYRHIEPVPFTTLTALEVLANTFEADLQYFEIYTLGGPAPDSLTHALLKRAVLVQQDDFLRALHRVS